MGAARKTTQMEIMQDSRAANDPDFKRVVGEHLKDLQTLEEEKLDLQSKITKKKKEIDELMRGQRVFHFEGAGFEVKFSDCKISRKAR